MLVVLWQTVNVQRQANQRAALAEERLRIELAAAEQRLALERAAAEERSARELASTQKLHKAEMESQQKSHRAELDAHHQQAELERTHLRNQLQKQAVIEVSRAVSLHTQMLATLWNRGAGILGSTGSRRAGAAMLPIFEQIGQVVNDFSVELANAHQIVDDTRLNRALEGVNEAVLMGIRVAQDVCDDIVEGRTTEPNPIPSVQRTMYEKAAEARRLAWDLVADGSRRRGRVDPVGDASDRFGQRLIRPLPVIAHADQDVDGDRRQDFGDSVPLVPEEAGDLEHNRTVGDAPQPPGNHRRSVVADPARTRSSAGPRRAAPRTTRRTRPGRWRCR